MIGYKPMSVKDYWEDNLKSYSSDRAWFYHLPSNVQQRFDWRWLGRKKHKPNTDRDVKTESDE